MQDIQDVDSEQQLIAIFCEIRDLLSNQDVQGREALIANLLKSSLPNHTMSALAPFLFIGSSENKLSNDEALSVLSYLVATDAATYLRPAARAVKLEAQLRSTSPLEEMIVSNDLLQVIVSQLSGNDVEVASHASETILACCRKLGLAFVSPAMKLIRDAWMQAWGHISTSSKKASILCIRCADVLTSIMVLDDYCVLEAKKSGCFDFLLAMLQFESDPLLQMSTLDLLERLASTRPFHSGERARTLVSEAVLRPLLSMAGGMNELDPDPILGGPALRVLGVICKLGHQTGLSMTGDDRYLLTGFHRALHTFTVSSELDRLAMIEAISSFAMASPDALDLVLDDPVIREAWLSLSVSQPKLKSAIMYSVAMVMNPALSECDQALPNGSGLKLYSLVGRVNDQQPTDLILSFARSALPEIRLGAYALLESVAKLPTGAQVLLSYDGFLEFLLSREGESTKEGREERFKIVEAIHTSEVKGLLADDVVRKIELHIKQGPHYKKVATWDLATE